MMASIPYFNAVTSKASFATLFAREQGRNFEHLPYRTASQWGRDELLAARVIRRSTRPMVLPMLRPTSLPLDTRGPSEIKLFIEGPKPGQLALCEHHLVHHHGSSLGGVWAALAKLAGPESRRTSDEKIADDSSQDLGEPRPRRAGLRS